MLQPRIIPCLLISDNGLVKTKQFKEQKYVGDPINAIRIFNEKKSDELIVLDIDATTKEIEIDLGKIKKFAAECRMPLCYGGGIKTVEQAKSIISLGVEKVAISSIAVEDQTIINDMAKEIGSQSIVVVLDVKKNMFGKYTIFTHNGKRKTGIELTEMIERIQESGAGEVVINSIDNDGMMNGYDIKLAKSLKEKISIPLTIIGGAGSHDDLRDLIGSCGIVGAAAGSLFVFKGIYRAVLINYPDQNLKNSLLNLNYE